MPLELGYWRRLQIQLVASVLAGGGLAVLVRLGLRVPWIDALSFALPLSLAAAPLAISAAYFCRALPLSRTPAIRLGLAAMGAAVVSGGVWAAAGSAWWALLSRDGWVVEDATVVSVLPVLAAGVGGPLYLVSVAVHYVIHAFEESAEASRRVLASEVAHRDAELRALRAQVDPHFLFNSLNSIAGLIAADPAQAREMCQRLADFLRESLDVGTAARIPLGREVALAEQYLKIEQVRFGRRLGVRTSVSPDVAALPVPPLMLQPLVENAVRHGIATRLDGGTIELAARTSGDRALIDVDNPRDPDTPRPGLGRGLDLVRQRVLATFGSRAALAIQSTPDAYHVTISLPIVPEDRETAVDIARAAAEAPGAARERPSTANGLAR